MSEQDLEIRGIHYIKRPRRQKILATIILLFCFFAFLTVFILVKNVYNRLHRVNRPSIISLEKPASYVPEEVKVISFSLTPTTKEELKAEVYPNKKLYTKHSGKHFYQEDDVKSEENISEDNLEDNVNQEDSSNAQDDTQIAADSVESSAFDPEYRSNIEDKTQKINALLESVDQKLQSEGGN